ncbi:MAG: FRG domain-containing protein [Sulfurovaceae bacterium]
MEQQNKIGSVSDAIKAIHFCGFEKGQLLFRGQVNYHWEVNPSLYRVADSIKHARLYETATIGPLLFQQKFPYLHSYDPIEHLMIAQHFGIPTRLLDWTYDILVALFFACYDPDKKHTDVDGRLFLLEGGFFKTFSINSLDQKIYKNPIDLQNTESHASRLNINDICIINPVIRNPRMRAQDGCFLFFPWQFSQEDTELLTFQRYIREQWQYVEKQNTINDKKHYPIFSAYKRVRHDSKMAILQELDEKYGISEKTLLVDSMFTKEITNFYSQFKDDIETKSRELIHIAEIQKI